MIGKLGCRSRRRLIQRRFCLFCGAGGRSSAAWRGRAARRRSARRRSPRRRSPRAWAPRAPSTSSWTIAGKRRRHRGTGGATKSIGKSTTTRATLWRVCMFPVCCQGSVTHAGARSAAVHDPDGLPARHLARLVLHWLARRRPGRRRRGVQPGHYALREHRPYGRGHPARGARGDDAPVDERAGGPESRPVGPAERRPHSTSSAVCCRSA